MTSKSSGLRVDGLCLAVGERTDWRIGIRYGATGIYVFVFCVIRCIERIICKWKGKECGLETSLKLVSFSIHPCCMTYDIEPRAT